jgi:hypothetical protein
VRRFVRRFSSLLPALAVLSATAAAAQGVLARVAWGMAFLVAATIGLRLSSRAAGRPSKPGPITHLWRRSAWVPRFHRDPCKLIVQCERRIGRAVDAAGHLRVQTPSGTRDHVLAVAADYVWWLELPSWRGNVGPILLYRPLDGPAAHSETRRGARHLLELSWPASAELFIGTFHGPGADRLVGRLSAEQFARVAAVAPAHDERR